MYRNFRQKLFFIFIGLTMSFVLCLTQDSMGLTSTRMNIRDSSSEITRDDSKQEIEQVAIRQLNQAAKRFEEKQYWQSAMDLIVILDFYSDFSKIDDVIYLLGCCLYEMELYDGADLMYRHLLNSIPKTPLLPEIILALQKTYFHKNEYLTSLKFYSVLEGHYTTHKAVDESRYYAGQGYYRLKNYNIVNVILQQINKDSEFYSYGLYTSGLVYLKKKDVRKAAESFIKITKLSAKNEAERELIDAARLTLGYLFFELSSYKTAIKYLVDISVEFYDYPEALLTLGWSAYKLQDYRAAITALYGIVNDYPDFYNQVEAHFLLGQCYLKLGYYDFSVKEFSEIIETQSDSIGFSSIIDEIKLKISEQESKIENLKTDFLVLESKFLNSVTSKAGNAVPDYIEDEHNKLKNRRKELINKIVNESQVFADASYVISKLKAKIEKVEMQKSWQSYAEYGKARALYLKGTKE